MGVFLGSYAAVVSQGVRRFRMRGLDGEFALIRNSETDRH